MRKLCKWAGLTLAGAALVTAITVGGAYTAVQMLAGIAVAQSAGQAPAWRNVCDAFAGDNLTNCVLAAAFYLFDGTDLDRARGDTLNGLDVDVTRLGGGTTTPSDTFANPSTALTTWALCGRWDGTNTRWERCAEAESMGNLSSTQLTNVPGIGLTQLLGHGRLVTGEQTVSKIGANGHAQMVTPMQGGGSTARAVSAANTEVTLTNSAAANIVRVTHKVAAFCSAGTATLTLESPSGTVIWGTPTGGVGTALVTLDFNPAIRASAANQAMVARLTACGAGNTGTLMAQFAGFGE